VHALPMRLRGEVIGALNLFRAEQRDLGETDIATGQALADVATIAILQHRAVLEHRIVNEQLDHALSSRIVIEQAKGVLSERAGLDIEAAFGRLRQYARNNNLKLADVAEALIQGTLSAETLVATRGSRSAADS
jgi:GAF domain-containing protein